MHKFCRLIGNEWKKQFRKKACWVMLILLAVLAVGYSLIVSFSSDATVDYWYAYSEEEYRWQIEENERFVDEVDENGDPTEFALACRLNIEYYQYLLDHEMFFNDWRTDLVYEMFYSAKASGDTARFEHLKAIVENEDITAYFNDMKAGYERDYANDPEALAILIWKPEYCIANGVYPSSDKDWRYEKVNTVANDRYVVLMKERQKAAGEKYDEETLEAARNRAAIAMYQLENDIAVNPADSLQISILMGKAGESGFWNAFACSKDLISVIGLFVIVIAGSIVSNEFSQGTIKFLLINPVKRWKILMSKYATVMIIGVLMLAILFVFSFVSALIFGGASEALLPAIEAEGGVVHTYSPYLSVLGGYLLSAVEVVVMATLAFAISALVRSSAPAIGISLFAYLGGTLLVTMLQAFGFDWARYLLFANLDFSAIVNGTSMFAHQSIVAAVVIVVLHMVVFLLSAWDAFVRREV